MSIATFALTRIAAYTDLFWQGLPVEGSNFETWIIDNKRLCETESHPPSVSLQHDHTGVIEIVTLLYAGHSARQLGMVIQSFVARRGINLTPKQVEAGNRFREANCYLLICSNRSLEHDSILLEYFDIFNDMFFFGALKFCISKYEGDDVRVLGDCTGGEVGLRDRRHIPPNFACLIRIRPRNNEIPNRASRLKDYMETLLHEMLHAWFSLYACRCPLCALEVERTIGGSGHADAWQMASLALEKASGPLLGMELAMGREDAMAVEYGDDYESSLNGGRLVYLGHQQSRNCGSCAIWRPGFHLGR